MRTAERQPGIPARIASGLAGAWVMLCFGACPVEVVDADTPVDDDVIVAPPDQRPPADELDCETARWRFWPGGPSCDDLPWLCGHPAVSAPAQLTPGLEVVFVPEGFRADELDEFSALVGAWITGVTGDETGIIGRAPARFGFHRVLAASWTDELESDDASDTLLGACVRPDDLDGTRGLGVSQAAATLLAKNAVDDPDVVITVINTEARAHAIAGRAMYAEPGQLRKRVAHVTLDTTSTSRVLTHELAHALIGLGDEYVDVDACYAAPNENVWTTSHDLFSQPNLTLDPDGAKWSDLVDTAMLGGARHAECVYRPTNSCLMFSRVADPFCPVCEAQVGRFIAGLREEQDGPPECHLTLFFPPDEPIELGGLSSVMARVRDYNAPTRVTLRVDGEEVGALDFGPGAARGTLWTYWNYEENTYPADVPIELVCEDSLGAVATDSLTLHFAGQVPPVWVGDYSHRPNYDALAGFTEVTGDVQWIDATDVSPLATLETIGGDLQLDFQGAQSADLRPLDALRTVDGSLTVIALPVDTTQGFASLSEVGGAVSQVITHASGMHLPSLVKAGALSATACDGLVTLGHAPVLHELTTLAVTSNQSMTSFDLPALRIVAELASVKHNAALEDGEIGALLSQLDSPPTTVEICENLLGEPCP